MNSRARTMLTYLGWLSAVGVTRVLHHQLSEPVRFWSTTVQMVLVVILAVYYGLKIRRMNRELLEAKTRLDVISEVATAGLVGPIETFLEDASDGGTITL